MKKSYFLYILYCNNHTYYTGYTTDLVRRYQEHLKGSLKCKYTRSFPPLKIAQSWQFHCELALVMQFERLIKKMSKTQKEEIILYPEKLTCLIEESLYENMG